MKNILLSFLISFSMVTNLLAADHVQNNPDQAQLLPDNNSDEGIEENSDCICEEKNCAIAAGWLALVSSILSLSAISSEAGKGIPGEPFSDNKYKDIADLFSKPAAIGAVFFSESSENSENTRRRSHFNFDFAEKTMLYFSLTAGSVAGVLSTISNFKGKDYSDCSNYGKDCYKLSFGKNSLNSLGLSFPVILGVAKQCFGKKNIRPHNHAMKIKALQRHLGWWGVWSLSVGSNICSWTADLNASSTGPAVLGRDITSIGASIIELISTSDVILNMIIQTDNSVGFGIYENPGQALLAGLPPRSQSARWSSQLCKSCWRDGNIQIEYLKHPETKQVIGLEFVRKGQQDKNVILLLGKIESTIEDDNENSRFTFTPSIDPKPWVLFGTLCDGGYLTGERLSMDGHNEAQGAQVMHDRVNQRLEIDLPAFNAESHIDSEVKTSGDQIMYKDSRLLGNQNDLDIMFIFPTLNSEL